MFLQQLTTQKTLFYRFVNFVKIEKFAFEQNPNSHHKIGSL